MENTAVLPIVNQTFNPVPDPRPVKPNCIKLYSECDYKGQVKEICENVSKLNNFPKISGYSLEKVGYVRLYDAENCFSEDKLVRESNVCLSNNEKIISIVIDHSNPPTGCVWLFDDYCNAGNKLEICENVSDLNNKKYNFGDKTSSFKLGAGIENVKFFIDKDFKGNYIEQNREMDTLYRSPYDKDIESIQINITK